MDSYQPVEVQDVYADIDAVCINLGDSLTELLRIESQAKKFLSQSQMYLVTESVSILERVIFFLNTACSPE